MEAGSGSERARRTLSALRRRISSGEWPVNSRIPIESELMELLGVGKTTVREAVRSLASLGILETIPGRGTFVRSRTPVNSVITDFLSDFPLAEVLVYRRALEIEAAKLAATHRSEAQLAELIAAHEADVRPDPDYPTVRETGRTPGQFHALLVEATGSRLLPALYAGVMASVRAALDRGRIVFGAEPTTRHHDHAAILRAIEGGDPVAAERAMAAHLEHDLIPAEPGETAEDVIAPQEAAPRS